MAPSITILGWDVVIVWEGHILDFIALRGHCTNLPSGIYKAPPPHLTYFPAALSRWSSFFPQHQHFIHMQSLLNCIFVRLGASTCLAGVNLKLLDRSNGALRRPGH